MSSHCPKTGSAGSSVVVVCVTAPQWSMDAFTRLSSVLGVLECGPKFEYHYEGDSEIVEVNLVVDGAHQASIIKTSINRDNLKSGICGILAEIHKSAESGSIADALASISDSQRQSTSEQKAVSKGSDATAVNAANQDDLVDTDADEDKPSETSAPKKRKSEEIASEPVPKVDGKEGSGHNGETGSLDQATVKDATAPPLDDNVTKQGAVEDATATAGYDNATKQGAGDDAKATPGDVNAMEQGADEDAKATLGDHNSMEQGAEEDAKANPDDNKEDAKASSGSKHMARDGAPSGSKHMAQDGNLDDDDDSRFSANESVGTQQWMETKEDRVSTGERKSSDDQDNVENDDDKKPAAKPTVDVDCQSDVVSFDGPLSDEEEFTDDEDSKKSVSTPNVTPQKRKTTDADAPQPLDIPPLSSVTAYTKVSHTTDSSELTDLAVKVDAITKGVDTITQGLRAVILCVSGASGIEQDAVMRAIMNVGGIDERDVAGAISNLTPKVPAGGRPHERAACGHGIDLSAILEKESKMDPKDEEVLNRERGFLGEWYIKEYWTRKGLKGEGDVESLDCPFEMETYERLPNSSQRSFTPSEENIINGGPNAMAFSAHKKVRKICNNVLLIPLMLEIPVVDGSASKRRKMDDDASDSHPDAVSPDVLAAALEVKEHLDPYLLGCTPEKKDLIAFAMYQDGLYYHAWAYINDSEEAVVCIWYGTRITPANQQYSTLDLAVVKQLVKLLMSKCVSVKVKLFEKFSATKTSEVDGIMVGRTIVSKKDEQCTYPQPLRNARPSAHRLNHLYNLILFYQHTIDFANKYNNRKRDMSGWYAETLCRFTEKCLSTDPSVKEDRLVRRMVIHAVIDTVRALLKRGTHRLVAAKNKLQYSLKTQDQMYLILKRGQRKFSDPVVEQEHWLEKEAGSMSEGSRDYMDELASLEGEDEAELPISSYSDDVAMIAEMGQVELNEDEEKRTLILGLCQCVDPWPENNMFDDVEMINDGEPVFFCMPRRVLVDKIITDEIKASRKGPTKIISIAKLSTGSPTERTYGSSHHIVCSNRNVPTYRLVENYRHMPNMATVIKRSDLILEAGLLHSIILSTTEYGKQHGIDILLPLFAYGFLWMAHNGRIFQGNIEDYREVEGVMHVSAKDHKSVPVFCSASAPIILPVNPITLTLLFMFIRPLSSTFNMYIIKGRYKQDDLQEAMSSSGLYPSAVVRRKKNRISWREIQSVIDKSRYEGVYKPFKSLRRYILQDVKAMRNYLEGRGNTNAMDGSTIVLKLKRSFHADATAEDKTSRGHGLDEGGVLVLDDSNVSKTKFNLSQDERINDDSYIMKLARGELDFEEEDRDNASRDAEEDNIHTGATIREDSLNDLGHLPTEAAYWRNKWDVAGYERSIPCKVKTEVHQFVHRCLTDDKYAKQLATTEDNPIATMVLSDEECEGEETLTEENNPVNILRDRILIRDADDEMKHSINSSWSMCVEPKEEYEILQRLENSLPQQLFPTTLDTLEDVLQRNDINPWLDDMHKYKCTESLNVRADCRQPLRRTESVAEGRSYDIEDPMDDDEKGRKATKLRVYTSNEMSPEHWQCRPATNEVFAAVLLIWSLVWPYLSRLSRKFPPNAWQYCIYQMILNKKMGPHKDNFDINDVINLSKCGRRYKVDDRRDSSSRCGIRNSQRAGTCVIVYTMGNCPMSMVFSCIPKDGKVDQGKSYYSVCPTFTLKLERGYICVLDPLDDLLMLHGLKFEGVLEEGKDEVLVRVAMVIRRLETVGEFYTDTSTLRLTGPSAYHKGRHVCAPSTVYRGTGT